MPTLKILRLAYFTEMLWVTVLALLSCGTGNGKAQKATGAHRGKPEWICLLFEPLKYLKQHQFLCIFYAERQRKDCSNGLPEWGRETLLWEALKWRSNPHHLPFAPPCPPPPNINHEEENKVRPVIFLYLLFLPLKMTTCYRQEATAKSCSPSILYHLKKHCDSDHKATGKSSSGRAIYLQR